MVIVLCSGSAAPSTVSTLSCVIYPNTDIRVYKSGMTHGCSRFPESRDHDIHCLVLYFVFLVKALITCRKSRYINKENSILFQLLGKDLYTNGNRATSRYTKYTAQEH